MTEQFSQSLQVFISSVFYPFIVFFAESDRQAHSAIA